MLLYFMTICNILWRFGLFYGDLVYFMAIWYNLWPFVIVYSSQFGMFGPRKSGNPDRCGDLKLVGHSLESSFFRSEQAATFAQAFQRCRQMAPCKLSSQAKDVDKYKKNENLRLKFCKICLCLVSPVVITQVDC
jgi:hypothetical protein